VITIIFWNIDKQSKVLAHTPCLASTYSVDVFLLAEAPKNITPALQALNALAIGDYREEANATAKIRAVTRLGRSELTHRFTGIGRLLSVWSIRSPKLQPEVLLAAVHMPSKAGGNNDADQLSVTKEVVNELNECEDRRNHRNTVLVGDFNMHPYDSGMTSVTGMHGLMTRKLAEMPDRLHLGLPRRRFYNPMWGLFGDRTPGPAGTHFWRSSVLHNPHWGMIDQVLLRPAMIDRLNELTVLESDGAHMLLALDGAPDKTHLSDHLPVMFRLDI
jgi:endonuclease/exonuclease/phosphatase family metal-dependent hydrolase